MLNYAPAPMIVNPLYRLHGDSHGPHMFVEWWLSHGDPANLSKWQRPWRGSANSPDPFVRSPMAFAASPPIPLSPDWHGWLAKTGARRFPAHRIRIAGLTSDGNAQMSSVLLKISSRPLALNMEAPFAVGVSDWSECGYPTGSSAACQSYVMVELQDPNGVVIEGFEKEGCVLQNVSTVARVLSWHGTRNTTAAGIGRQVQLRFSFRRAIIFVVSEMLKANDDAAPLKSDDAVGLSLAGLLPPPPAGSDRLSEIRDGDDSFREPRGIR